MKSALETCSCRYHLPAIYDEPFTAEVMDHWLKWLKKMVGSRKRGFGAWPLIVTGNRANMCRARKDRLEYLSFFNSVNVSHWKLKKKGNGWIRSLARLSFFVYFVFLFCLLHISCFFSNEEEGTQPLQKTKNRSIQSILFKRKIYFYNFFFTFDWWRNLS